MHDEAGAAVQEPAAASVAVSRADSAARRAALDRATLASLLPALRLLTPTFLVLAVLHTLVLQPPAAWTMACLASVTSAAYGAALVRLSRVPLDERHARGAAVAIAGGVLVNTVAHLLLVGDPIDTTNVLLFIVGAGFVLLSRTWLTLSIVLAWAGWGLAALVHAGQPWGRYVFALASATVLAVLAHMVRVRTVVRLERLRAELEDRVQERTRDLASSNALLRAVTEHLPDAVVMRDPQGIHRFANAAATTLAAARGAMPLLGRRNSDTWSATEAALEDAEDAGVLATGQPVTQRAAHVDGSWPDSPRAFVVSKYQVRADGAVSGVLDLRRDVTEALRQEQARLEMEQRVQHAQKLQSLGVLTGGIAHDFNNLMMGVLGGASLIRADVPDATAIGGHLSTIEASAQQASDLCRQLLAYAGRGPLVVERLELNAIVQGAMPLMRVSASRQVDMAVYLSPDAMAFDGDASQIRQGIINLVINAAEALHARPDGVIRVSTGRVVVDGADAPSGTETELSAGAYAYVEVADNGPGMSSETRAHIFEPFFTTKFTGRGLGLAVVLGIARSHRGTVQVTTEPGRGAAFRMLVPIVEAEPPPRQPLRVDDDWPTLAGEVLLVDDERIVREVVGDMLRRFGMRPVMAADGLEGLARFEAEPDRYGALIVDLVMPMLDGRGVLSGVRALRPDVPVLIISGFAEEEIAIGDPSYGPVGFLQKPFTADALGHALVSLLRSTT